MRMYLRMFAKTFRPSITPPSSTMRSFSNKIKSADSLAMSTAVSTEMPMSAACNAGASLIPSPMNPTTCPLPRRRRTIRCLWAGVSRAKSVVFSAASASSASDIFSTASPRSIGSGSSPTSRHTLRLIRSLSPVRIFTPTPCLCRAWIAIAAVPLGGSRNATYPFSTRSRSSSFEQDCLPGSSLTATAKTRKPSLLRLAYSSRKPFISAGSMGDSFPSSSN